MEKDADLPALVDSPWGLAVGNLEICETGIWGADVVVGLSVLVDTREFDIVGSFGRGIRPPANVCVDMLCSEAENVDDGPDRETRTTEVDPPGGSSCRYTKGKNLNHI